MDLIIYIDDFFNILEYVAPLAILVALIQYIREIPQRKRQAELNAWQVINSAMNQKAASGRVEALEYLNNTGVDLSFLDVHKAYLVGTKKNGETRGINLPDAKLEGADFYESTLSDANFRNANLQNASLWEANLQGANLSAANLAGANLRGANLEGAKMITSDQLCKAKTLYKAKLFSKLLEKVKKECPKLLKKPKPVE